MQIELTPEQDDVVRFAIARPEDAMAQAMAHWIEAERRLAELIASLDEAEYARGESIRIDSAEDARALVADLKARYREPLAGHLPERS